MREVSTYLQEEAPTTSLHPFPVPIDGVYTVLPPTIDTVPLLVRLIPCPIPTMGGIVVVRGLGKSGDGG